MSHATDFPANPGQSTLTKITVDNRNFWLEPRVAPLFKGFLEEIVARGYSLDEGILDDWSYAERPIRGSHVPSEHSRGTAIDINAVHNPMGSTLRTDMPWWVPVVAKKWGLRWGGDYTTRKDAMHFEYVGLARDIPAILAANTSHRPAPVNAPDEDGITPVDSKEAVSFLQVLLNLNGQHVAVDGVYGKATGQAIRNLKEFYNEHHIGQHEFDLGRVQGWKAGPKFLETLSAWTNFLKAHGAF
jgi:hypothetical protein